MRARGARGAPLAPAPAPPLKSSTPAPTETLAALHQTLLWKDPVQASVWFTAGNACFLMALFSPWSGPVLLGALTFYAILLSSSAALLGCAALSLSRKADIEAPMQAIRASLAERLPPALKPGGDLISPETAAAAALQAAALVNAAFNVLKRAATAESLVFTLLVLAGSFALQAIGGVGTVPLLWVVFTAAFTLPKLIELHGAAAQQLLVAAQAEVEQYVGSARDWAVEQLPKVVREALAI